MQSDRRFIYRGTYDENLPLPARLTLQQYRRVVFRPDAHFVEGEIVARHLGDSTHSRMVSALIGALDTGSKLDCLNACISLRLQVAPDRIRVCDIVVLAAGAPREDVPTIAPLLCVEVLSPSQVPEDEEPVLRDYVTIGVKNIWLIDTIRKAAYTFDTGGFHDADATNLSVPDTSIRIDLTSAFAKNN